MWYGDVLWSAGADGWLRQWQLNGNSLTLREEYQTSGPLRLTVPFNGGWVSSVREGELLISHGPEVLLRLELERRVDNIDASSDGRFVAASILGETIVVDLQKHSLATVSIDTTPTDGMNFVDPTMLAVSTASGLKAIRVTALDYVKF
jgi:hypothetical protein